MLLGGRAGYSTTLRSCLSIKSEQTINLNLPTVRDFGLGLKIPPAKVLMATEYPMMMSTVETWSCGEVVKKGRR
jgi:hypothetical protein